MGSVLQKCIWQAILFFPSGLLAFLSMRLNPTLKTIPTLKTLRDDQTRYPQTVNVLPPGQFGCIESPALIRCRDSLINLPAPLPKIWVQYRYCWITSHNNIILLGQLNNNYLILPSLFSYPHPAHQINSPIDHLALYLSHPTAHFVIPGTNLELPTIGFARLDIFNYNGYYVDGHALIDGTTVPVSLPLATNQPINDYVVAYYKGYLSKPNCFALLPDSKLPSMAKIDEVDSPL